ncbi:MAG: cytochrome c [Rhodobacteraceae bacterium]|nr:cytochrome c [Paracoccaceae bacterium]
MKNHTLRRRFVLYGALIFIGLLVTVWTTASLAQNGVTNHGVFQRMAAMGIAKTAVGTLTDMVAGRVRFDRKVARAARKNLIRVTRHIPKVFKRPDGDRLSRAKTDIWLSWADFEIRAETAERAARRLRVGRLTSLQRTLPDMLNACLNCHQAYRKPGLNRPQENGLKN